MIKNKIAFSDAQVKRSVSDYKSFEEKSIPNINIEQEYIKKFIHKPTDTPDIIDCKQIEQISNAICDFIQNNNGKSF
ncbi:M28 family peptidase [Haloimpatiens myeolchijeotgali]|uniref:M28 family peptidase n=1 Tax=Haloimpatiens sp. FM7330 TaxID=3298610 RepID=UPI00384A913E